MLTGAIVYIQNVQLICFAIVFAAMALHDRENRSLRWLAFGNAAGLVAGVLQFGEHVLPLWASLGLGFACPLVGYACFYVGLALFAKRGLALRWVSIAMLAASLPVFLSGFSYHHLDISSTVQDLGLAIQTTLSLWLLLTTRDRDTLWPRRAMAAFLAVYSAVEYARVGVYLATGEMPFRAAPRLEFASAVVYIISASVLPLAFIWMMNLRLTGHLLRMALLDPLTRLMNRRGFESACVAEVVRSARYRKDLALVIADLDHFKRLNDTYGHAAGDIVLCGAAAIFERTLRQSDTVGRLGGEEFVFLLPNTGWNGAVELVERVRAALELQQFQLGGGGVAVTSSFGIALSAGRAELSWETLLQEADIALYAAKRAGRNTARVYNGDLEESAARSAEMDAEHGGNQNELSPGWDAASSTQSQQPASGRR